MVKRRKDHKNRVLKEGEYQRKDLMYEYKYRDPSGKRRSIYAKSLDELRLKEDSVRLDLLTGVKPTLSEKSTIDDLFIRWRSNKIGTVKDNTFQSYVSAYKRYIEGGFGSRRFTEVKKSDICAFYSFLHQRGLKCTTVDTCHTVLLQLFSMAFDDGDIRRNPASNAFKIFKKALSSETEKRKALTVDQQDLLERYIKNTPKEAPWYPITIILLYTGLRIGEAAGLRWQDVHLQQGYLDINHTLVYYCKDIGKGKNAQSIAASGHNGYAINTPKTEAGNRKVPMCDKVKEAFLLVKQRQEELGIRCDYVVDGYTDFVFMNKCGNPLHAHNVNLAFDRITRECNALETEKAEGKDPPVLLPHFSCHILRHTFATRSVEAGCSIKALTSILGHSSVGTITYDVYADSSEEFKRSELMKVAELGSVFGLGEKPNAQQVQNEDSIYDNFTTNLCQTMPNCAKTVAGAKEKTLEISIL